METRTGQLPSDKRLFIGIPLDRVCQQHLDESLAILRENRDVRWVSSGNRHLTLAFLGNTTIEVLHQLQKHFANAYPDNNPFIYPLTQMVRFPDAQGHIVAAVNAPSEALMALHQQTLELVSSCGLPVEGRPYRPHVTLGRIQHPRKFLQEIDMKLSLELAVGKVCLYESVPTEQGRLYKVLSECAF